MRKSPRSNTCQTGVTTGPLSHRPFRDASGWALEEGPGSRLRTEREPVGRPRRFSSGVLQPGLLEPEAHLHLAIHRSGHGEVLASLSPLAESPVEGAETEVAMGDQRT